MTIDTDDLINSIMESLDRIKMVSSEDIPNIDLYVDQVTTFMDRNLKPSTRYKSTDKILTKTMINNYAKNDLLPPPVKKKYNREHILVLIFIYYFKNVLSINDIQSILNPLTDKYFGKDSFSVKDAYEECVRLGNDQIDSLKNDVKEKYEAAMKSFDGVKDEEKEFLQTFSFVCLLMFDVYTKKLLIEKIIDDYNSKHPMDDEKSKK